MSDNSSVYGYYGRVSDINYYTPPPSPPFIPQPAAMLLSIEEELGNVQTEEGEMIDMQQ